MPSFVKALLDVAAYVRVHWKQLSTAATTLAGLVEAIRAAVGHA